MPNLQITRRPIVLETRASEAKLTEILARIEAIKGRASEWGVTDSLRASLLAGTSVEADFTNDYYRVGFVEAAAPTLLPGWSFTRTGAGHARTQVGRVEEFATGVARITDRGLLMESSAVNLLLRSEDLSASPWTGNNVSVTPNAGVAPDGTSTASKVEASGTASVLWLQIAPGAGYTPGNTYQIFVKKGSGATQANKFLLYNATPAADLLQIEVNYDTGAITYVVGTTGAVMTPLADGWWVLSMTATTGITTGDSLRCYAGFVGATETVGEYCWAWGAQLSLGTLRPSYISTTSATAVRGADTAATTVQAPSSGAFFAEIEVPLVSSTSQQIVGAGTEAGLFLLSGLLYFIAAGVTLPLPGAAPSPGSIVRVAASWGLGRRAVTRSGLPPATDTAGGPSGVVKLGTDFESYIRKAIVYRAAVTDAELQEMTA